MAQFHERRMLFAAKIETTEGTRIAPAGADADMLIHDVTFTADVAQFDRRPIQQTNWPVASIPGGRQAKITFKAELKGSGAAGTAPKIGKLIKAAGFGETVVVSTSVTYDPIIVVIPTLTIDLFSLPESGNNIRASLKGCRCSGFKLPAPVGSPGLIELEFSGVYDGVTDQAALTPTGLETTKPPAFLSGAFTCQAFSPKVSKVDLDLGLEGTYRSDVSLAEGYLSYALTAARPMLSFDPEKELIVTHDYYGLMLSGTEASMTYKFGATAGNIVTISGPKAQYLKVTDGSRNGLGIFNVEAKLNGSVGNDAIKIAFT